jgi:UPF0716 protein FxsA
MGFVLLAMFVGVPLIEIALFIQVGGFIGLWPTIAVVILTAMAGAALLRHQGLGALNRLQQSLNQGEPPIDPVFDGFCLLAAGMLLLTPGFFTDAIGFLLFVPPFRAVLKGVVAQRIHTHTQGRTTGTHFEWRTGSDGPAPGHGRPNGQNGVIDGEFEDITDKDETTTLPKGGPGPS